MCAASDPVCLAYLLQVGLAYLLQVCNTGKSQYCTPAGPSIYIPTVKLHIKGNIWGFCVVTLESRGPSVPTCPLWQ